MDNNNNQPYQMKDYSKNDQDKMMNINQMQNQKQQEPICTFFQNNKCTKENCQFKHQYRVCQWFEQGFCPQGPDCQDKHVFRVLCHDYMYGYCPEGPKCDKAHPKIFQDSDFDFSKQYYKKVYNKDFKVIKCHTCKMFGHKATKEECYQKGYLMDPEKQILCGLCRQKHSVKFECEKFKELFSQTE